MAEFSETTVKTVNCPDCESERVLKVGKAVRRPRGQDSSLEQAKGGSMSKNDLFAKVVYDILWDHGPLRTADIYPRVEERIPQSCGGDWRKAVRNAQQWLKVNRQITFERDSGHGRSYFWQLLT